VQRAAALLAGLGGQGRRALHGSGRLTDHSHVQVRGRVLLGPLGPETLKVHHGMSEQDILRLYRWAGVRPGLGSELAGLCWTELAPGAPQDRPPT
jgi:hypothetical protein